METNLRVCSPQSSTREKNACLHDDGSGNSSFASVGSTTTTTPFPDPSVRGGQETITGADGGKVVPSHINGKDSRLVLDSLPPWTHFFFSKRSYQSLPVTGVLVPSQSGKGIALTAAKGANRAAVELVPPADAVSAAASSPSPSEDVEGTDGSSAVRNAAVPTGMERTDGTSAVPPALLSARNANEADSAATVDHTLRQPTTDGRVAANCVTSGAAAAASDLVSHDRGTCGTPQDSAEQCKTSADSRGEADDADSYWHLLHDTLVIHGGVTDLQYFVSTDGCRGPVAAPALAACTGGSVATTAEADTKQHTCATAASGTALEDKGGAVSNRHDLSARELEAQQKSNVRQPQETLRCFPEPHGEEISDHLLSICRVSRRVCGHKGVAHGGFIATLLDNAMGYLAYMMLPRPATKSLTVNYLKPLLADTVILVEVRNIVHPVTTDNAASTDRKGRQPSSSSRTASCTIHAKVYTCVPEQLRAMLPQKSKRLLAGGCSQRDEEGTSARQGGSVPPEERRNGQCCAEGNTLTTKLGSSCDDGRGNCKMPREVNGGTAGSCTGNEQTSNSFEPHEKKHHRDRAENSCEGRNSAHTTRSREAESPPAGVWLVATAEAVFVDVSAKWNNVA